MGDVLHLASYGRPLAEHESAHAAVACWEYRETPEFYLIWVTIDPDLLRPTWRGEAHYVVPHDVVRWDAEARIALAGNAWDPDPGTYSANDVVDAKTARAICGGGFTWFRDRQYETEQLLQRPDIKRAVYALSQALLNNGGTLDGVRAERIIREYLRREG